MKILSYVIITIITSFSILAAQEIIDSSLDTLFLPLIEVVRPFFVKLSFVVGGLFGATLLLVFVRVYYDRKTVKLLKAIKFDLDQVNKHMGINYSYSQGGIYQRLAEYLEDRAHRKALRQLHKMKRKKEDLKVPEHQSKVVLKKLK